MTNLDSILKSRDITLPIKFYLFKAVVFPVVMNGYKSWNVKKGEHRRIDAFELWCWRRLLRVPWTTRRSNKSILREIRSGCSLDGLMLKLKLQYIGHLMWRTDSLGKTLMLRRLRAGGEGDERGWDGWIASLTQGRRVWVNCRSWWWTGRPDVLWSMGSQSLTHLSNWTEVLSQIPSELDVACVYHQSLPEEGRSLSSTRCLGWGGRDSFWGSNRENVWMRKVAEWWITSNENTVSPTKKWDLWLNEGVIDPIRGVLKYTFVQKNPVGLPWWLSGYEPTCQWRRYGFDHWSGK